MKLEKKISLHAFDVEYIDQREAKPRTLHRESIVLDGGRMNTLDHLNQTPQSWIRQQYAQQGYTVAAIHKGEILTAKVDTSFLWKLAALDAAAAKAGKKAKVHIKVDTGMGRIGITPDDEGLDFVKFVMEHPGLEVEGIFTHFAKSDEADKTSANHQLELFQNFIDRIQSELGLEIPVKHCSNSAAILEMPQANMDMVRAGITTYGLYPSEEVSKDIVPLRAAMSLYSHIIYCKTIHAGQSVSYGGLFTATKDTRVATIPVGYGDGYPRSLSGKGYVLIHGKKAPILGRVCMDQFMVDISGIPGAMEGDKVTLLGADGQERITAEELGELSGRFNYEFVCTLGKRIPRVYRRNGEITEVKDYFENF